MTNDNDTCVDARFVPALAVLRHRELMRGGTAKGSVQPIERVRVAASVTSGVELTTRLERFGQGREPTQSDPGVGPAIGGVRG